MRTAGLALTCTTLPYAALPHDWASYPLSATAWDFRPISARGFTRLFPPRMVYLTVGLELFVELPANLSTVRFPTCAHQELCCWHIRVPQIGTAEHSVGDRPCGASAPCVGPREVRPKPHPKASYSELCGQQHNSEYDPFQIMAR